MLHAPDLANPLLTTPPPFLAEEAVLELLARHYGLQGVLSSLTSERDLNFRLSTPSAQNYVVKFANPAEPAGMTALQIAALDHIAAQAPDLPVPRIVAAINGQRLVPLPEGRLRVLTWLEGTPLHTVQGGAALRRETGRMLARLTVALKGLDHPEADHFLLWDIKQFPSLAAIVPAIAEESLRAEVQAEIERFTSEVAPRLAGLPTQIVHSDFNPHNLLVDPADGSRITGILDFGDMVRTPRICDLAIAASYQIGANDPLGSLSDLIGGYHAVLPLGPVEIDLLFDLITARMITTLAITNWRAALYPENARYILRNAASARAGLAAFRAIDRGLATETFARACGME
jgi:hydroxylysine kinase